MTAPIDSRRRFAAPSWRVKVSIALLSTLVSLLLLEGALRWYTYRNDAGTRSNFERIARSDLSSRPERNRTLGEIIDIQPQAAPGEDPFAFSILMNELGRWETGAARRVQNEIAEAIAIDLAKNER